MRSDDNLQHRETLADGPSPASAPPLRMLLLEDDPVVARFVAGALAPWPLQIEHATDIATARAAADGGQRLWLFDARLPDGDADALLPELRARGLTVPAVALTGDDQVATRDRLLAAGFARVLVKPIAATALRATLLAWLPGVAVTPSLAQACAMPPDQPLPWNDRAAEAALGDAEAVRTLRRLFLDELPGQRQQVLAACRAGDARAARERLHRLQAGCGFVGAAALMQAVRALASAPEDLQAQAVFGERATALLATR